MPMQTTIRRFVEIFRERDKEEAEAFYYGQEMQELLQKSLVPAAMPQLAKWSRFNQLVAEEFCAHPDGPRGYANIILMQLAFSRIFPLRGKDKKRTAFEMVADSSKDRTDRECLAYLVNSRFSSLRHLLWWRGILKRPRELSEAELGAEVDDGEKAPKDIESLSPIGQDIDPIRVAAYSGTGSETARRWFDTLSDAKKAEVTVVFSVYLEKLEKGHSPRIIHGVMKQMRGVIPGFSRKQAKEAVDFVSEIVKKEVRELSWAERKAWFQGFWATWSESIGRTLSES
jgi:ribosomal protein L7/L12